MPDALETELLVDPIGELRPEEASRSLPILFIYHRDGVRRVPLTPDASWIIGREAPSDIRINDSSLSRQHAHLMSGPRGELWIQDLDSTNGTQVNGVRVDRGMVRLGDEVTVGAVTLALHLLDGARGEPVALQSHDRFVVRLAEEIARARTFRRGCALLMVRCAERHVSGWLDRLPGLRVVDHVGLYAADCLEVLLCEAGSDEARDRAEALARELDDLAAVVAVGAYPRDAGSVGALIDRCRQALSGARPGVHPVPSAPGAAHEPARGETEGRAMRQLHLEADRVADSEIAVLILGETGAGKEVLARRVHGQSRRRSGRFCVVNCAAIPSQLVESTLFGHERGAFTGAAERREGLFEAARGGTLFLDEVGELSLAAQAALLRALDSGTITRVGSTREVAVDVRVLAATNRDLDQMVREGSFRQDLLYRLNSVVLRIPPLRERRDAIGALAATLLASAARADGRPLPKIDPPAMALLESHHWPGNVRELRNVIERAVVICQEELITTDDLPERLRRAGGARPPPDGATVGQGLDFKELVQQYECRLIIEALRACEWNQSEAARRLSMPRRTLVHKMKTLGIRKLGFAAAPRE